MIKINMVELEQIVKDMKLVLENAQENDLPFPGHYYGVFSERISLLERIGVINERDAGRFMTLLRAAVDRGVKVMGGHMTIEEKIRRRQHAND